jgi:hypothetical protein
MSDRTEATFITRVRRASDRCYAICPFRNTDMCGNWQNVADKSPRRRMVCTAEIVALAFEAWQEEL